MASIEITEVNADQANFDFIKEGDNVIIPILLSNGQTVLVPLTPKQIDDIKNLDVNSIPDTPLKKQYRVVYEPVNNLSRLEGFWTDRQPSIEEREVPATTESHKINWAAFE